MSPFFDQKVLIRWGVTGQQRSSVLSAGNQGMSTVKDEYDDLLDELGLADSPIKEKIVKSPALTAEISRSPQQGMEHSVYPREDLKPRLKSFNNLLRRDTPEKPH